jgi:hypothetical protein
MMSRHGVLAALSQASPVGIMVCSTRYSAETSLRSTWLQQQPQLLDVRRTADGAHRGGMAARSALQWLQSGAGNAAWILGMLRSSDGNTRVCVTDGY